MDATTDPQPQPAQQNADPYADADAIKALVKKRVDQWGKPRPRYPYLMAAERNIHYKHGNQWIVPLADGMIGWRPMALKKGTPTPVTNLYASTMKTFASLLARFEPSLHYRPATQEPEDQATADVSSRVIEVVEDEVQITPIRQILAEWVTHTGGAWLESGYDPDPRYGTVPVPMQVCPECGPQGPIDPSMASISDLIGGPPCPECGIAMAEQDVQMPRGRQFTEVVSLFEMLFDPMVTDPTKHRTLIRLKSYDVDEARQRWDAYKDQIQADSIGSTRLSADALTQITPNVDDGPMSRWYQQGYAQPPNRVTEYWYWQLPDATYPDGLLAIMIGRNQNVCVYKGPLPYYATRADGSRDYFLPFQFFAQEYVPGSAWPKTVANDVVHLQKELNIIQSKIRQMIGTMANAIWMVPQGSNLRTLTGIDGQIVEYNNLTQGGRPPTREQGLPINMSLIEYRQMLKAELQELASIFDVMSGNRPEGVSAGISLQILKERGESRFGPMFILWNHAWAEWSRQQIEIFRLHATEERLLRIKGRDGAWEVKKFMASDLKGRIDVVPEATMTMPRSTLTDRAEMEQLAAAGAIQPQTNVEHQIAYLTVMGKLHVVMPGMQVATKRAFMENEGFEALAADPVIQQIPPEVVLELKNAIATAPDPVMAQMGAAKFLASLGVQAKVPEVKPAIDDHAIHGREQRNFAQSERFDALPPVVQTLVELHLAAHDFLRGQAIAMMQNGPMNMKPAAGFLAPPGPRPGSQASTSAMRGGSSPARVEGDYREQEERMARTG